MIVEKAVNMAKKMNVPILGLVENMSYLECPDCGKKIAVFGEAVSKSRKNMEFGSRADSDPSGDREGRRRGTVEYVEADFLDDAVKAVEEA